MAKLRSNMINFPTQKNIQSQFFRSQFTRYVQTVLRPFRLWFFSKQTKGKLISHYENLWMFRHVCTWNWIRFRNKIIVLHCCLRIHNLKINARRSRISFIVIWKHNGMQCGVQNFEHSYSFKKWCHDSTKIKIRLESNDFYHHSFSTYIMPMVS